MKKQEIRLKNELKDINNNKLDYFKEKIKNNDEISDNIKQVRFAFFNFLIFFIRNSNFSIFLFFNLIF